MILINTVAKDRMGMIAHYSAVSMPISVGMLAGYLLEKGRTASIIDEQVTPLEHARPLIEEALKGEDKPFVFGISCLTINIHRGLEIARILKSLYPDSKVIVGGIHATVLPEEVLGEPAVDIVVRGEGEQTLLSLNDALKEGGDLSGIAGISFRQGTQVLHTPDRPLEKNLDSISFFPYHLFDVARYNLSFVMTSRGCPFDCIFCSQKKISGRLYRFRSARSVVREIELLVDKYGQKNISFLDDDFLVDKARVKEFCDLIASGNLHKKTTFSCQARADNITEDVLRMLKEVNFTKVGFGFETGVNRLMKIINKNETVEQNIAALKLLEKNGFSTVAFFMFGIPTETHQDRLRTYLLAKQLKIRNVKFNNIVPYPGTRLFEIAQKQGRLQIEPEWKNFNSVGSVVGGLFSRFRLPYIPEGCTEFQLKKDIIRANLYFYLTQPSILLSVLRRENTDWFELRRKWYFSLREYYHLLKLGISVFVNALFVFDLLWCVQDYLLGTRRGTGKSDRETS